MNNEEEIDSLREELEHYKDQCSVLAEELLNEIANRFSLEDKLKAARKMAGEQWARALAAEARLIPLMEENAELDREASDEAYHCCEAEEAGQYYLTVLGKVANWFAERDLPCPICGKNICDPDCELKSALEDLL